MMPIAPLMIEHRLIERMIGLLRQHLRAVRNGQGGDAAFVGSAVDFLRTYADRCHHGKEEGILFRGLAVKRLSPEEQRTLGALVQEHAQAREIVGELVTAEEAHLRGDGQAACRIVRALEAIVGLYPGHIRKEDRGFFIPIMRHFTEAEQARMLAEMQEFDREFVHTQYRGVVEALEKRTSGGTEG